ncbi:MAG: sulfatase-like hydrolase/transferase [Treponema sp.]|nr:sulfatase-like hydrolase/transferase [Treponema sp.]
MKRPNILILHTDQQRFDALGANGNRIIKTPNLDRLAAEGVNYSRCFVQNPVCMPSRISAMTGQYCSSLGITRMGVPVPQDTLTIQKILKGYGYDTALIGKLHYLPHANRDHSWPHPSYDFNHMELSDEPGCYEDAYRAFVARKAPDQLDLISLGLPPAAKVWQETMNFRDGIKHPENRTSSNCGAFPGRSDCTHTAFVGEQTIEYLKKQAAGSRPFFCFSGFYSPHSPCITPQEFIDLYPADQMPVPHLPQNFNGGHPADFLQTAQKFSSCYYAMISEVDAWAGRILDALDQSGLADDTIVVFTSDHGEWLGEHLKYGKGYWAPDIVSRVPMIYRIPKALGGVSGLSSDEIVECVDIVPTLLNLCAIPIAPCIQGRVLPVAAGCAADDGCGAGDGCGLTEMEGWRSLRSDKYRYVAGPDNAEMLFDLNSDPYEYENVARSASYRDALHEMRGLLIRRMIRIEHSMERSWVY